MKTIQYKNTIYLFAAMLLVFTACERDIDDDLPLATYPTTAEVYTDAPVGLTDEFFISFDPAAGANTEGFGTDNNEAFMGTSSIRIDVPAPNDPDGGFIGGIFKDRGNGRDLSGYTALTFWAKGSTTATVGTFGFGTDFENGLYPTTISDVQLSTDWKKYFIPIPNPAKLTQEKGMFLFSAGTESTNGAGYTFWIDEIRFEDLGTISLQNAYILNGEDIAVDAYVGSNQTISGLGAIFNLPNGLNQPVNAAPAYFDFSSSNSTVTGDFGVNSAGQVFTPIIGEEGTAVVTASLGNDLAQGSLTINAAGEFPHAPVPARPSSNVVSLFSDAYSNVPVRHYNGYFAPYQTTQGGAGADPNNVDVQAPFANGALDNIINYTMLNFVSIGTYETVPLVDISGMSNLHLDINVREAIESGDFIRISLESGTGTGSTTAGNFTLNANALSGASVDENGWASIDIPISSFSGFSDLSSLGQVFFISDGTISNIWVDNVYFYSE